MPAARERNVDSMGKTAELENVLVVVRKSPGPTSFDVVEAFRRATGIRRVGHTGSLDPLAGGVLLLCTGRATRAVEQFMNLDKVYEFTVRLGVETTTLDAEGQVVREMPVPAIAGDVIVAAAERFVGDYRMRPPAYSALKRQGRRMYELARAGEEPVAEERQVRIHELVVTGIALPDVHLRTRCSRGTYVRSLARDFGAVLGLPAHLGRLVRTAVGPFSVEEAYPCEKLFAGEISDLRGIDMARALDFLPGIVLAQGCKRALLDGVLPRPEDVVEAIGSPASCASLRILDEAGELLGIGTRSEVWRSGLPMVGSFRLMVDRESASD
jgi:tRNA pseudouridine55 synthase